VEEQAKERFLQYSIHLATAPDTPGQPGTDQKELDWGYLQIVAQPCAARCGAGTAGGGRRKRSWCWRAGGKPWPAWWLSGLGDGGPLLAAYRQQEQFTADAARYAHL